MVGPLEKALLDLPLNKLLRLTTILTEMYPEQVAEAPRSSQKRGEDQSNRIASRLIESVLPIFGSDENGRPTRIGTCVLAMLDSNRFAFTAGHVLDHAARSILSVASRDTLTPLPCTAGLRSVKDAKGTDLDFGIIPLSVSRLGYLAQNVFLSSAEIDEADMPDTRSLSSFYFVVGFPVSRKLFKIDHANRRIRQSSFQVQTSPPNPGTYEQEDLSSADYVLVEFDRRQMVSKSQQHTARDPKGISGGGIFYINKQTELGPCRHRNRTPVQAAPNGWDAD